MEYREILRRLESLGNPDSIASMKRFGIETDRTHGISVPVLRGLAKEIGKDHLLAQRLWESAIYEARVIAFLIDDPKQVTEQQMERWVEAFDSWSICDGCCANLFDKSPFAYNKAAEWSCRPQEYVKRAAFALMASLAVHDKKADDMIFLKFLPLIKRESIDERNFVKKAVNWALRQIGKRDVMLNKAAINAAKEIKQMDSKSAKWISADALRELTDDRVQKRLRR